MQGPGCAFGARVPGPCHSTFQGSSVQRLAGTRLASRPAGVAALHACAADKRTNQFSPQPPWLLLPTPSRDQTEGTDSWAVRNGWVAVTPVGLLSDIPLSQVGPVLYAALPCPELDSCCAPIILGCLSPSGVPHRPRGHLRPATFDALALPKTQCLAAPPGGGALQVPAGTGRSACVGGSSGGQGRGWAGGGHPAPRSQRQRAGAGAAARVTVGESRPPFCTLFLPNSFGGQA